MSVRTVDGVVWLERALDAAERLGAFDRTQALAAAFRNGEPMTAVPEAAQVRVVRDGWQVVFSATGVVLGFGEAAGYGDAPKRPAGPRRAKKGRKASFRGPSDFRELTAWLEEAGLEVRGLEGGHLGVFRGEALLVTMPKTASDPRSFQNAVGACRRETGLPLRRSS